MARFKADEVDNYGGNGGTGFFSLKDDKDVARVRFMYKGLDDVEGYAVHEVDIDGKKRYVNCLRNYDDPVENCPFCEAKKFQIAKLFIPLYDVDEERIKVWERGKKFFSKISSICARYSDLVSHIFEIERNGKRGSTQTTYEIYEVEQDNTQLEDLPELPEIIGGFVLGKTADEMEYYLDNGEFPEDSDNEERITRRTRNTEDRTSRNDRNNSNRSTERGENRSYSSRTRDSSRRTPTNSGRRDKF